jgi:hypothetical protein
LDVIDISAEGLAALAAYVGAESRAGRPPSGAATDAPNRPRRLTDCEAFLLRLGRKGAGIRRPTLVNAFRLCDNKQISEE